MHRSRHGDYEDLYRTMIIYQYWHLFRSTATCTVYHHRGTSLYTSFSSVAATLGATRPSWVFGHRCPISPSEYQLSLANSIPGRSKYVTLTRHTLTSRTKSPPKQSLSIKTHGLRWLWNSFLSDLSRWMFFVLVFVSFYFFVFRLHALD